MKSEETIVADLKLEGYDNVYAWDAPPDEIEEEHEHPFETKLVIVAGEMRINVLRVDKMEDFTLHPGQEIEINRGERHNATAGPEGCRYVVGEMH